MARSGTLRNVFTVGAFTSFSRVLGLVREMLQSRLIGAGVEQSAFTLAFAIPNMARKLFGEGALTAAFVPIFRGEVERGEVESAKRLARAVLALLMLTLGAAAVLAVGGLSAWLATCGADASPRAQLTGQLVRILIPYMLFICAAAFGMGVLNALGRFVEGAFMPVMLNILWIAALGVLAFFPDLDIATRVKAVSWAILAGGFAQMAFLLRCLARRGYGFRLGRLTGGIRNFLFGDAKVRLVWRNTAVAALGAGAVQINYMLDQVLAQLASPWAAGVIGYAERLMDLPLGVVGVAFGTVLLPTFSGLFARGDADGARKALANSVRSMMFVMLPAAAGLFVLAPEVTRVIYEGRAFDATATVRVSRALATYAIGLGFFGFQKSIIPWFQAQNDMKTPLRVSVWTVGVNAALNILAVWLLPVEWRHVGLAASTVFCAAAGAAALLVLARRKNGALGLGTVVSPLVKISIAALVMALAVWHFKQTLGGANRLVALGAEVAAGMGIYAAMALALRIARPALGRRLALLVVATLALGGCSTIYHAEKNHYREDIRAAGGLFGKDEVKGSTIRHWLLPFYISGRDGFFSIPYSYEQHDDGTRDEWYLCGLAGRRLDDREQVTRHWCFPFYSRDCEEDSRWILLYGENPRAAWLPPFYYRTGDRWIALLGLLHGTTSEGVPKPHAGGGL